MNINSKLEIAERYAAMHDSELLGLAGYERDKLSQEASVLLDREMARRGLHTTAQSPNDIPGETAMTQKKYSSVLPVVFDMRESGESNAAIEGRLIELGLAAEDVNNILSSIPSLAEKRWKAAGNDKLLGGLFVSAGFAVSLLPFRPGTTPLVYILAWTAVITGCLIFIRGWFSASRFSKILRNSKFED